MSIVLSYKFNTDSLVEDTSGNSLDLVNNGVTSVVDETYGKVALFNGSSYLSLGSGSTPISTTGTNSRSISAWYKFDNSSLGTLRFLYTMGDGAGLGTRWRLQHRISGVAVQALGSQNSEDAVTLFVADTWYHMVNVYDSSDGTVKMYINGVLESDEVKTVNTSTNGLVIGGDVESLPGISMIGRISDFRVYDDVVTPTTISTIYTTGPIFLAGFTPTMYCHAANLSWEPFPGASTYTFISKNASGDIIDTKTISTSEVNMFNLDDGTTYDFILFSDLDPVNPVYERLSISTPSVDVTTTGDLIDFVSNDLTQLDEGNVSELDPFIKGNLTTGEEIQARVSFQDIIKQDKTLTFVQESETLNVSNTPSILTPFVSGTASSDVTLELTNLSTETVSFNEIDNQVTVDSTTYDVGDVFILDGKKVKVSELN